MCSLKRHTIVYRKNKRKPDDHHQFTSGCVCVSILHKYREQENINLVYRRHIDGQMRSIYMPTYIYPCLLLCPLQLIITNPSKKKFFLLVLSVGSLIMICYVINNIFLGIDACMFVYSKAYQSSPCVDQNKLIKNADIETRSL